MGASITLIRRLDWVDTDAAGQRHHSTLWRFAEAGEVELRGTLEIRTTVYPNAPRRSDAAEFFRPVYSDDVARGDDHVHPRGGGPDLGEVPHHAVGRRRRRRDAIGTMTVVFTGPDGRSTPWPDDVRALPEG